MRLKVFFTISTFLVAINFNLLNAQQIPVLDLVTAIDHPTKIVLSDFIENMTYVKLETNKDCLIDENPKINVTKDYIVVTTQKQCLIFDRKSGSFIREIGRYGKGPGEFRNTLGFLDEESLTYFFNGWICNFLRYSLEGKFLGSVPIPECTQGIQHIPSFPDNFTYMPNNLILYNLSNIDGTENKSLMLINNKGEPIKVIPNRHILKKMDEVFNTKVTSFHHFNNSVYFQEFHNDTVFEITPEKITPYFVLKRGIYTPKYESLWWSIEKRRESKFIQQPSYLESPRFISFHFFFAFSNNQFFGLYDKKSKTLRITENSSGIKNDIDGFMDLTFRSKNKAGEMSCFIQSQDVISWFENNKNKSTALKPEMQILKTVQLGDNPIVVIAKFKQ